MTESKYLPWIIKGVRATVPREGEIPKKINWANMFFSGFCPFSGPGGSLFLEQYPWTQQFNWVQLALSWQLESKRKIKVFFQAQNPPDRQNSGFNRHAIFLLWALIWRYSNINKKSWRTQTSQEKEGKKFKSIDQRPLLQRGLLK